MLLADFTRTQLFKILAIEVFIYSEIKYNFVMLLRGKQMKASSIAIIPSSLMIYRYKKLNVENILLVMVEFPSIDPIPVFFPFQLINRDPVEHI